MKTIHKIKIDLLTPGLRSRVYVVQDDICTREVQISLYSGGASWSPAKASAAVGYSKPDGTAGLYDSLPDGSAAISISGNVVTVILAAQMLTCAGTVEAAVTLADANGNQISTFAFDVIVSANPGSRAVKSEDYFNYVNPRIRTVIERAEKASAAANAAADRANAASTVAYQANEKVDTLREVVSKLHSNIVETASGEVITVSDSAEAPLQGLKVYGKTTQNGTPTPDAPVALESVGDGGSVTTTVCGKNLFRVIGIDRWNTTPGNSFTHDGITWTLNNDGTITANGKNIADVGAKTYCMIKAESVMLPPGTYSFDTASGMKGVNFTDGTRYTSSPFTLNENKTLSYAYIEVLNGVTLNTVYKPQIEVGAAVTKYEPYKEPTTATVTPVDTSGNSMHLPGIPVTSGGNYTDPVTRQQWICDEVDFEKGVYVQRVGRMELDGSEDWTMTSLNAPFAVGVSNISDCTDFDIRLLCDRYQAVDISDSWSKYDYLVSRAAGNSKYLQFQNTNVSTLDSWVALLGSNPISVSYVLAEEKHIPLSELDPDALAQFASLRTNYPNTTVFNDAGAHMELKYVADTKKYVDNKFAELAAALVSST